MIFNLGLHLDSTPSRDSKGHPSLEDVEIRRRVFWGAFVSEKLQSLYLGRPFFLDRRDIHVPKVMCWFDLICEGLKQLEIP
jgi:hypothetical protein